MKTWNDLTAAEKLAHRTLVSGLGQKAALAEQELNESSAWIGKNGPAAAPFGRETVETRGHTSLLSAAEKAHKDYMAAMKLYPPNYKD